MHGDDEPQQRSEDKITGRRVTDDAARLIIAENSLLRIESKVGTLAEGLDVTSGILIGRPQQDGTVSVGLVHRVDGVREKQEETGRKLDGVIADMGDLKTAQADQGKLLAEHGTALERIEGWFRVGVQCLKVALLWAGRGLAMLVGIGALHLLYLWWPGIVNFFTWMPAATAAFFTTWAPAAAEASSRGVMH